MTKFDGISGLIVAAARFDHRSTPENGETLAVTAAAALPDLRALVAVGRLVAALADAGGYVGPDLVQECRRLVRL